MFLNELTELEVNEAIDRIAKEKGEVTITLFCSIYGNHDDAMTVGKDDTITLKGWITWQLRNRLGYVDAYIS